jgi:hypothetical protein
MYFHKFTDITIITIDLINLLVVKLSNPRHGGLPYEVYM